jgi:hypothetical protein
LHLTCFSQENNRKTVVTEVRLPLSVANTLEPLRASQDATFNGESAKLEADAPAGGVLSGFQLLTLRMGPGGGLN